MFIVSCYSVDTCPPTQAAPSMNTRRVATPAQGQRCDFTLGITKVALLNRSLAKTLNIFCEGWRYAGMTVVYG